jgi:hypothetical protein
VRRFSMSRALLWSLLIAPVAQLALAASVAAGTGGGNFPGF